MALLAFIVLGVITVVGLSFNYYASNSMRQVNLMQINEKAIFLGDAILELAKHEAERQASAGEFDQKLKDLKPNNPVSVTIKWDEGGLGAITSDLLPDKSGSSGIDRFDIDLTFSADKHKYADQGDFRDDSSEIKGKVKLTVRYQIKYKVFKDGVDTIRSSNPKSLSTEFEFKRVLIQPMAVRHFSLFAQDASDKNENPREYLKGKFNTLLVDKEGSAKNSQQWLKVSNGNRLNAVSSDGQQTENPFKTGLGYILVGTGGKEDKNLFLNLTAGNGSAAESFHMYRGDPGTSDFYRLFSHDYQIFTDDDASIDSDLESIRNIWKKVRDNPSEVDLTAGVPLYYLARKDYGYAEDWRNHKEFGFTVGDDARIKANTLHLFGSGTIQDASFSVVFGNVFRRCLSLSGYKQFKNSTNANASAGTKSFEIQAGPIYFYRDFDHLHAHKLYMGKDLQDWRSDGSMAPIEVWDQRMNWSDPKALLNEQDIRARGGWIFTSGDGLLLRIVPAIARFLDKEKQKGKELMNATVGFSVEDKTQGESFIGLWRALNDLDVTTLDKKGFVAPIIQAIYDSDLEIFGKKQKFPQLLEYDQDRFIFTPNALKISAYLREMLIMFYWTSFEIQTRIGTNDNLAGVDDIQSALGLDFRHAEMIFKASEIYQTEIYEKIKNLTPNDESYDRFTLGAYQPEPEWVKNSRVYKKSQRFLNLAKDGELVVPYYTLPDPWEILLKDEKIPQPDDDKGNPVNAQINPDFKTKLRKKVSEADLESYPHNKTEYTRSDDFQSTKVDIRGSETEVSGYEGLFETYFRRVMTDPAWVLPYNHSLRFAMDDFKKQYFQATSDSNVPDRDDFMKDVFPEFRDAIGYHKSDLNPYMKDKEHSALGPDLQKEIIKKYRDGPESKLGYFFASEFKQGSSSLEEVSLSDLYKGRCVFHFDDEDKFKKRFTKNGTLTVNTIVCLNIDLNLKNEEIKGRGVIWSKGKLKIDGSLSAENIVFVTPEVEGSGFGQSLKVGSLIVTKKIFNFFPESIDGNLVVAKFGKVTGGDSSDGAALTYNSGFLKTKNYAVSFQPFIDRWNFETK